MSVPPDWHMWAAIAGWATIMLGLVAAWGHIITRQATTDATLVAIQALLIERKNEVEKRFDALEELVMQMLPRSEANVLVGRAAEDRQRLDRDLSDIEMRLVQLERKRR